VFPLLHVTLVVMFNVLPSVYVPVAVKGNVVPRANELLAGVTAIDTSTGTPTVNVAVAETDPSLAVIVAVPSLTPLASPPAAIVAIVGNEELQLTVPVRFCVLPSLYVPVAVYCCVVPSGIVAFPGVTAREVNTGGVTVSIADPLIVPEVAVIVAVPCATLVARPLLLTVATLVADDVQVTVLVRF